MRPLGRELAGAPIFVVGVEPADGAAFVFRDTPVLARLSHPVDPASLSRETFHVRDGTGAVPSCLEVSADGTLLIWRARRLLTPEVEHVVVASGLRDRRGREVTAHESRFTPGHLAWADLPG